MLYTELLIDCKSLSAPGVVYIRLRILATDKLSYLKVLKLF